MERLSIDEVLAHCRRTCEHTEMLAIAQGKTQDDITSNNYWEHYQVEGWLKELKAYRDAEKQGLLLRLPCKYNDDLYWIANGYAQKVWFKGIRCDKGYKPQIIATYIDGSTLNPKEIPITLLENIGRTVFLTKEEAEKELERLKNNE